jgi:hypothetical protein
LWFGGPLLTFHVISTLFPGTFQWDRVDALVEQQKADAADEAAAAGGGGDADADGDSDSAPAAALPEAASSRARLLAAESASSTLDPAIASAGAAAQAAQAATPLDSLVVVLGSRSGATLRRIARDLDSTDLLLSAASRANRPARRLAVTTLAASLDESLGRAAGALRARGGRLAARVPGLRSAVPRLAASSADEEEQEEAEVRAWPVSEEAARLAAVRGARARKASALLLRAHAQRQVAAGWRGAAATGALVYVVARIGLAAVARVLIASSGRALVGVVPARAAAAAASAVALVAARLGRRSNGQSEPPSEQPNSAAPLAF